MSRNPIKIHISRPFNYSKETITQNEEGRQGIKTRWRRRRRRVRKRRKLHKLRGCSRIQVGSSGIQRDPAVRTFLMIIRRTFTASCTNIDSKSAGNVKSKSSTIN